MADRSKFSAKAMFDELDKGPQYTLTGMVKADPNKTNVVLFSDLGDCSHWMEIDEKLISEFERHGSTPCDDHSHPVVTLHLKHPKNTDQQLFAKATPRVSNYMAMAADRSGGGPATPCIFRHGKWVCP